MKIMEIISDLTAGGGQRFVVDLSNALTNNHNVTLLTFRSKVNDGLFYINELDKRIKHIDYKGTPKRISKFKQFINVLKFIKNEKPDIVHCHMTALPFVIIPSLFMRNTKFFYTVHNEAAKDTNSGLSALLRKVFLRKHIHAITISNYCKKTFIDFYGYPPFATIENGCRDISTTTQLLNVQKEIKQLKHTQDSVILINVARIQPQKNHILLVQAIRALLDDEYDIELLIIGGYEDSEETVKNLKNYDRQNHIHFLGKKNNVADYLSCADYFVLSSAWEGLPISLLEAGFSGCYPISTPVGGVPDVIESAQFGTLSDNTTLKSFVQALKNGLNRKVSRNEIKELYMKKYSMKTCAQKYIEVFNQ